MEEFKTNNIDPSEWWELIGYIDTDWNLHKCETYFGFYHSSECLLYELIIYRDNAGTYVVFIDTVEGYVEVGFNSFNSLTGYVEGVCSAASYIDEPSEYIDKCIDLVNQ